MKLKLADIHTHPDLQARVKMNEDMIETLAEVYRTAPEKVKAIEIFEFRPDQKRYVLDGHHRLEAAKRAGLEELEVDPLFAVLNFGIGVNDAMKANTRNGVPLSKEDIRRAVEILLKYDPSRSIENICAILSRSKSTIYQYVRELSDAGKLTLPETRKGKDGKERPTKYADRVPKETSGSLEPTGNTEEAQNHTEWPKERDESGCFAETVCCGNGGCRRTCSPVYLDDLRETPEEWEPGDWVFGTLDPGKAYCSEECRTIAEGKVLEKEADRILKTAESAELAENSEPEEMEDPTEDEKSSADVAHCPVCGRKPNMCIDGSITCWGSHTNFQPDHELAIHVGKKRTREQVLELWNRLGGR